MAQIASENLVVLRDDRHLWPPYNVAPVVRRRDARRPAAASRRVLDGVAPAITDRAAQRMNAAVEGGKQDPADVAAAFLRSIDALSGAAIRFDRVRVRYPGADRDAVDDVSFEVAPGEFWSSCSGRRAAESLRSCGRSNRLVPTDAPATSPSTAADVADVDPVELRRHIGYAIQAVGLFAHMTVAQNVASFRRCSAGRSATSRRASTSCWRSSVSTPPLSRPPPARALRRRGAARRRRARNRRRGRARCSWTNPLARSTRSSAARCNARLGANRPRRWTRRRFS